ncbi:MAG TPA: hypothetical protein VI603_12395 [Saprospiraceae bacterium]|nr:hypothetical protein [Saprospiraceae bacterium]
MKVITAFREGWKMVVLHRRMWLILYLVNLVFAVVATIAFRGWLKDTAGYSLALAHNIGRFDFTFITDLIRNYGGLSLLCEQVIVIAIAYLIFSAFLVGGILHIYLHQREKFSARDFLSGGALYFWRMLRLAGYFLLIQFGLLAIFCLVFIAIGVNPKEMESDVQFLQYVKIILPVYLFMALVIVIMHDYVKIYVVQQNAHPMTKAFGSGIRFVMRHFGSVLLLYMLNLLLLIIFIVAYSQIRNMIPTVTPGGILVGFILSQLFLIGRIGVKLLILSSVNQLVQQKNEDIVGNSTVQVS